MRYLALATDYDGTIATSGHLSADVTHALERLRMSGRRTVLITGRTLEELVSVCPNLDPFAVVVVENGAVLHVPSRRETRVLCQPVPASLARELAKRGVEPLIRGRAILATRRPHEVAVLESIRDLGLELQNHLQRAGGNGFGFRRQQGQRPSSRAPGTGPFHSRGGRRRKRKNNHSFLDLCECAVAVENAVDAVKAKADFTTSAPNGGGVV